jgi:hypothetical protein
MYCRKFVTNQKLCVIIFGQCNDQRTKLGQNDQGTKGLGNDMTGYKIMGYKITREQNDLFEVIRNKMIGYKITGNKT